MYYISRISKNLPLVSLIFVIPQLSLLDLCHRPSLYPFPKLPRQTRLSPLRECRDVRRSEDPNVREYKSLTSLKLYKCITSRWEPSGRRESLRIDPRWVALIFATLANFDLYLSSSPPPDPGGRPTRRYDRSSFDASSGDLLLSPATADLIWQRTRRTGSAYNGTGRNGPGVTVLCV